MSEVRTIYLDWYNGSIRTTGGSQLAYQYDHLSNIVIFSNAPRLDNYYLIVEMKEAEDGPVRTLEPIQLGGSFWLIPNSYTQLAQNISFQVCCKTPSGDFERHSAQFTGVILPSKNHDGEVLDVDPSIMFDPYKQWVSDIAMAAGAIVIDPTLSVQGAAADAKAVGDAVAGLDERVETLEEGGTGSGLTADVKAALLAAFNHVAWDSDDPTGQSYITALQTALYPPANLSRITAVYTQPGTVWTTDTLDSLKANLVVTAYYSDNTSEVVSNYTLSGTLSEGTRTITVAYGGKTTTFTVVVSEFSTAPVIMTEGVVWSKNPPNTAAKEGFGITQWYEYDFRQEDIENSRYWDAVNGYMSTSGWSGVVVYISDVKTLAAGYSWPSSSNYKHAAGLNGVYRNNVSPVINSEQTWAFTRYSVTTVENNGLSFSIPLLDADDCYAYWHSGASGAIYPMGVSDGDIIFAGRNTPYYGLHNISEASE